MCIIIHQKPQDSPVLPFKLIEHSAKKNPHGHGLMYAHNNKLVVKKQTGNIEGFYKKYTDAYSLGNPLVLHFRIGTSGKRTLPNVHPHFVTPNLALVHNGVLGAGIKDLSDTRRFIKEVLKTLPDSWYGHQTTMNLLAKYIQSDKMVFMDNTGAVWFLNYEKGTENKELKVWFSNSSYLGWNWTEKTSNKRDRKAARWDKETLSWIDLEQDVDGAWETHVPKYLPVSDHKKKINTTWPYLHKDHILCLDCVPLQAWENNQVDDWGLSGEYACDFCGRTLNYEKTKNEVVLNIDDLRTKAFV